MEKIKKSYLLVAKLKFKYFCLKPYSLNYTIKFILKIIKNKSMLIFN